MERTLEMSRGQKIVAFLGATGSGKSTLINILAGVNLVLNNDEELGLENPNDPRAMKIGDRVSETLVPKLIDANGYKLCDLGGYSDTRGAAINLLIASYIKKIIESAASVKLVLVFGIEEVDNIRGTGLKKYINSIKALFPGSDVINRSSLLAFTRCRQRNPEDLVGFLNRRVDDPNQEMDIWKNNGRVLPVSRGVFEEQKRRFFEKFAEIDQSTVTQVDIEHLYSNDVSDDLKEVFEIELTGFYKKYEKDPASFRSLQDIHDAINYVIHNFEQDIRNEISLSEIVEILKPLSGRLFIDEETRIFAGIRLKKEAIIAVLRENKERLEKEEAERAHQEAIRRQQIEAERKRAEERNRIQEENRIKQEAEAKRHAAELERTRIEAERKRVEEINRIQEETRIKQEAERRRRDAELERTRIEAERKRVEEINRIQEENRIKLKAEADRRAAEIERIRIDNDSACWPIITEAPYTKTVVEYGAPWLGGWEDYWYKSSKPFSSRYKRRRRDYKAELITTITYQKSFARRARDGFTVFLYEKEIGRSTVQGAIVPASDWVC